MIQNNILLIFEGAKTEVQLYESFKNLIFTSQQVITISCYGNNIYQMYEAMQKDDHLNVLELLKARGHSDLEPYEKDDFGEIYLFFDYDCHHGSATPEIIENMLGLFSNETEQGLLFVNYPMVESILHSPFCSTVSEFIKHKVAKEDSRGFKSMMMTLCQEGKGNDIRTYDMARWAVLFALHCQKANHIVNGQSIFPEEYIEQLSLFFKIKDDKSIPVLSSFPLLYLYYHGRLSNERLESHSVLAL